LAAYDRKEKKGKKKKRKTRILGVFCRSGILNVEFCPRESRIGRKKKKEKRGGFFLASLQGRKKGKKKGGWRRDLRGRDGFSCRCARGKRREGGGL